MKTATIMTIYTHARMHAHIHRYLFTGIMPSINTAVSYNTYICTA